MSREKQSCIPSVALKQGRISPVASIYPKGEFLCCFACQSVASSPDSNEGCHQEAEGISCPHKGSEQRYKGGHYMKRLKHEAKHTTIFSLLHSSHILIGDQIWLLFHT